MADHEVSIAKPLRGTSMHLVVTGRRQASVRIWLGFKLMQIAAKVWGCDDVEIVVTPIGAEQG